MGDDMVDLDRDRVAATLANVVYRIGEKRDPRKSPLATIATFRRGRSAPIDRPRRGLGRAAASGATRRAVNVCSTTSDASAAGAGYGHYSKGFAGFADEAGEADGPGSLMARSSAKSEAFALSRR
ncbi:hypothetical protein Poly21_17140 [Allorhodopirellula heiligendammensis]|uniref:Uncharacterized protein n=1 Tax=Allorhodopirellula heiligendammensis TaxID=2714739 RepID=A0A5C6C4K2_9BACT|nr:hypothetical protein Poly21_17140 [Allorhodopirellula heiligendammensis]